MVKLRLRGLAGQELELDVEDQITVAGLKVVINEELKIPPPCQEILHCTCPLEDTSQVSNCKDSFEEAGEELTLTLVLTLAAVRFDANKSNQCRIAALGSLGNLGTKGAEAAVEVIAEYLQAGDPDVRMAALQTLGMVVDEGHHRAIAIASQHLDRPFSNGDIEHDWEHKACRGALQALSVLATREHLEVIDRMCSFLRHEDSAVSEAAVQGLRTMAAKGKDEVIQALGRSMQQLKQPHWQPYPDEPGPPPSKFNFCGSIVCAWKVVVKRGDPFAVDTCLPLAMHRSAFVRCTAVKALATIVERGDEKGMVVLRGCLKDKSPHVRHAAVQAVGVITTRGDGLTIAALLSCLKDQSVRVRGAALCGVCELAEPGDAQVIAAVSACLDDADWGVRQIAVQVMSDLVDKVDLHVLALVGSRLQWWNIPQLASFMVGNFTKAEGLKDVQTQAVPEMHVDTWGEFDTVNFWEECI